MLVFVFLVIEAMNRAAKPRHEIPKSDNPAWSMKGDAPAAAVERRSPRGRFAVTRREVGEVLLKVDDVWLSFGGVKAIQGVSFDVREHEIRAIIGPNGAGKSSMLNVINGVYHPQQGRIIVSRQGSHLDGSARRGRRRASDARSRASRCSRACQCSTTS